MLETDAEIFAVGKIAESATFSGERGLSLQTDFHSSSEASYQWKRIARMQERSGGRLTIF